MFTFAVRIMLTVFSIILRHMRTVAGVTIAAALISAGISLVLPQRYVSSGSFIPAGVEQELSGGDNFFGSLGALGETYATFVRVRRNFIIEYIVRSRRMAELMSERFDLKEIYGRDNLDEAWRDLRERTSMVVRDEGVLVVGVEDSDPVRARDMVSAYIELTDTILSGLTMENARSKTEFLEEEVRRREAVIEGLDSKMQDFMEENGLFAVREQAMAAYSVVSALAAREVALEVEKEMALVSMREGSTHIERLETELGVVRTRVEKIVKEEGGGALFPPLDRMPDLSEKYLALVSERMMEEFALAFVRVKLADASIASHRDVSVIRVIDPPYVPEIRSWPKRKQIVVVSTLAALFWTCFVLLVFDRRGRSGDGASTTASAAGESGES